MTEDQAIEYLTRCANPQGEHWSGGFKWHTYQCPTCHGSNDAGHLRTPGSRYGHNSRDCAPVAYATAVIVAGETGTVVDEDTLTAMMSLVVNNHDDPENLIRDYGASYGFDPEDLLD